MRTFDEFAQDRARGARDKVVEDVIQNSLLEPTGKTYFDFSQNKFVIVEPKILPVNIELWSESTKKKISGSTCWGK